MSRINHQSNIGKVIGIQKLIGTKKPRHGNIVGILECIKCKYKRPTQLNNYYRRPNNSCDKCTPRGQARKETIDNRKTIPIEKKLIKPSSVKLKNDSGWDLLYIVISVSLFALGFVLGLIIYQIG